MAKNATEPMSKEQRTLDHWYSLRRSEYLELLEKLPPEQRPQKDFDLLADFVEFVATPE
jgi:hypothetical protein